MTAARAAVRPWLEPSRVVPATPFVKWAGGKRSLLPELRKHVPEKFDSYFEPFVGGGALYFDLVAMGRFPIVGRCFRILSDANDELMATYRAVRDDVEGLIKALSAYERAYAKKRARSGLFYHARDRARPRSLSGIAARMIFLNRTCFNGLYRVRKDGGFNTPHGKYENPTICDADNLRACSRALAFAGCGAQDFAVATLAAGKDDFVYFDPPYWPKGGYADFVGYTIGGFSATEQERLRNTALDLKRRGVHVLLSNADMPEIRALYRGFEMRRIEARRAINSSTDKRGPVGELLIW